MTITPVSIESPPKTQMETYVSQHSKSKVSAFHVEIEPGWTIYVEESGNPEGIPVVFLHGGPGSRFLDTDHQWFDPQKYRIILFQQRGTLNCIPSSRDLKTPASTFKDVTIHTLSEDLEKLKSHLDVDQWLVFGGSWGSTLGLYYAQQHPDSCLGLVLRGIFLSSEEELEEFFTEDSIHQKVSKWDLSSLQRLFDHAKLHGISPTPKTMCETYRTLIIENNDKVAARIWRAFEKYMDDPSSKEQLSRVLQDDIETNSDEWSAGIWETQMINHIIKNQIDLMEVSAIQKINGLPIKIVQGKNDTVCTPDVACDLVEKMRNNGCTVDFSLIDEGCHSAYSHPGMIDALVRATDQFADKRQFSG